MAALRIEGLPPLLRDDAIGPRNVFKRRWRCGAVALEIVAVPSGPLQTNAYLVADRAAGVAWAVDPAPGSTRLLLAAAKEARITRIIDTHGHWDHVTDNSALHDATGAPVAVHAADAHMLSRPEGPHPRIPSSPDEFLEHGQTLRLGAFSFRVLHTPGHTEGSVCLWEERERALFTGDTLFRGTYGRTDLPGGSAEKMKLSLRRLSALPEETVFYPGHGESSTIGEERWLGRQ